MTEYGIESHECIICGKPSVTHKHWFYFCEDHKEYAKLTPEDLQYLTLLRAKEAAPKEIEAQYNQIYNL